MKKIILVISLLSVFVCVAVALISCNTNYDVSTNSFQTFNYVYIISEDKYIEISTWLVSDYGTLKFVDKDGCHYCICQSNWILYESVDN